jgi:hypothetical protein
MQQWRRVRDPTINVGLAIWVERQAFVCESSIPIVETLIRDNDAERLWVCWPVPVQIERVEGFRDGRRCKDATLQLCGAAKAWEENVPARSAMGRAQVQGLRLADSPHLGICKDEFGAAAAAAATAAWSPNESLCQAIEAESFTWYRPGEFWESLRRQ